MPPVGEEWCGAPRTEHRWEEPVLEVAVMGVGTWTRRVCVTAAVVYAQEFGAS